MKKIAVLIVIVLFCGIVKAQSEGEGARNVPNRPSRVPAAPYPVPWVQPSGDTIMIRVIGDERWSCRLTLDGFVLVENKRKALCYAKLDKEGNYRPTCIVARKPEERTRRELRYIEKMKKSDKLWRRRTNE